MAKITVKKESNYTVIDNSIFDLKIYLSKQEVC